MDNSKIEHEHSGDRNLGQWMLAAWCVFGFFAYLGVYLFAALKQ